MGEGMGKRNVSVKQTGRRKAVAHIDRLSFSRGVRISSLFKDRNRTAVPEVRKKGGSGDVA